MVELFLRLGLRLESGRAVPRVRVSGRAVPQARVRVRFRVSGRAVPDAPGGTS